MRKTAEKIIVALDVRTKEGALDLVGQLRETISFFKIGLQLYTAGGPEIVREVLNTGARVFLDLKLHDIPNTVAAAVQSAAELGVQMLTIHLSGGEEMVRAAMKVNRGHMQILGVTVLTSMDDGTLGEIGVRASVSDQVSRLAQIGLAANIDGLVSSPHEAKFLRAQSNPQLVLVVPGVRPSWAETGDQKRVMTPREALGAGADYLVIGRPITAQADPHDAAARILAELE